MFYIKCNKCSNVHSTFLSNSFSTCGCGGQMKLINVSDEQHRKAVSALHEYLHKLVTLSLERVQELQEANKAQLPRKYENWSTNWLLKNNDARRWEVIESICRFMENHRDTNGGDETFDAADWAVITTDAAERAVSWFEEGKVYGMLWWLDKALYAAEAVKGLSAYPGGYEVRKAEVMALLKENGYEVAI